MNISESSAEVEINRGMLKLLCSQVPIAVIGAGVGGISFAFMYSQCVKSPYIVYWLGVHLLIGGGRLLVNRYLAARLEQMSEREMRVATWLSSLGCLLSGSAWGMVVWLFSNTGMLEADLLVWLFWIGATVMGMPAYSATRATIVAYNTAIMSVAMIGVFLQGGDNGLFMTVIVFILLILTTAYCQSCTQTVRRLFSLGEQNGRMLIELEQQKRAAEKANQAKTQFLAAASHDLRQPMHALGLYIDALQKQIYQRVQPNAVQAVAESFQDLSELLESLLDMSKLDSGVVQVESKHFYMRSFLKKIISHCEPDANSKNIKLTMRCAEVVVESDLALLGRIVRNLLANAIKYTDRGKVLIAVRRRGQKLLLSIYDTGFGIEEREHVNIFTEFYQLGNPERDRNKGLGLGLPIVKRLCQILGYEVKVSSIPGRGSVFSVLLPEGDAKKVEVGSLVQNKSHSLAGLNVLVVDDEAAVLRATKTLLASWGCNVVLADGVDAALEKMQQVNGRIDLIVSDYRLRNNQSGIDAVQSLQNSVDKEIPAIFVSGDTGPETIAEIQKGGFLLLHKPLRPVALRNAMHRAFSEPKIAPPLEHAGAA